MNRTLVNSALLFVGSLALFCNCHAVSLQEEYDLSERCGKQAREWFRQEWGKGISADKDGQTETEFVNHYSLKLNRCFILLKSTRTSKRQRSAPLKIQTLFDANENKSYGTYSGTANNAPTTCEVSGKICHSIAEWEQLILPYMEE